MTKQQLALRPHPVLKRTPESYLRQNVKPARPVAGYVYLIEAANRLVKIGFTTNLNVRFRNFELISPIPIKLLFAGYGDGANIVEYELCKRFAEFHSHGEWFSLNQSSINEAKELICLNKLKVTVSLPLPSLS